MPSVFRLCLCLFDAKSESKRIYTKMQTTTNTNMKNLTKTSSFRGRSAMALCRVIKLDSRRGAGFAVHDMTCSKN